jgi:hypothetical protein
VPKRGCPPAWGLGVGPTTPHRKRKLVTICHKGPRTPTDSLDKRPKLRKIVMRFGTWNVRSMYRAVSVMTVEKNIKI